MQVSTPIRLAILALTAAGVFWFPWPITLVFIFLSGLVFPAFALAFGILSDILYYPGTGLPMSSIIGALLAVFAALVRYFVKTRIM